MAQDRYTELSELQSLIRERIGVLEMWVRVEIESHSLSKGHHYFGFIQKNPDGEIAAKARGTLWASKSGIISAFERATGKKLETGLSIVVRARVEYHPVFGLSLNISDIDENYSIGEREREKRANIEKLTKDGSMDRQKEIPLPYLPSRIALISSDSAAGYGDFINHVESNEEGYKFNYTLFNSLVQGDSAPESIISRLDEIESEGVYDVIFIFRGGGAESDLYCFDDYDLARRIADCHIPVLTAIGHERDYHIADMVSHDHFKTPTALADFLIDWVYEVEARMTEAFAAVQDAMTDAIARCENEATRCVTNIRFAINAALNDLENKVALLSAGISNADPRSILRQGYVLAVDEKGTVLKNVNSKEVGGKFSLRFAEGLWRCLITDKKIQGKDDK